MPARTFPLIAVAVFLLAGITSASDSRRLPGSTLGVDEAFSKSYTVFVGQFTSFGRSGACGPGETDLYGSKVDATRILKGTYDPKVTVAFAVLSDLGERRPEMPLSYVFFVKKNDGKGVYFDPYAIVKLLPATDDNIAKVRKLISN